MADINLFQGKYRFLSNFHPSLVAYGSEHWLWPTVEHAYQAAKTFTVRDREEILNCGSPGKAKSLGQSVLLIPDWDKVKRLVMLDLLRLKFQHPGLRNQLLDTGDVNLIEGNTWGDTYWGVCNGRGENWLGVLLTLVRGDIRGDW